MCHVMAGQRTGIGGTIVANGQAGIRTDDAYVEIDHAIASRVAAG